MSQQTQVIKIEETVLNRDEVYVITFLTENEKHGEYTFTNTIHRTHFEGWNPAVWIHTFGGITRHFIKKTKYILLSPEVKYRIPRDAWHVRNEWLHEIP